MRIHDYARTIPPCFPADTDLESWSTGGRDSLLRVIGETEYGFPPMEAYTVTAEEEDANPGCCSGRGMAFRLLLTCTYGERSYQFPLSVFLPIGKVSSPCILFINNRSPQFTGIHRLRHSPFLPVEELLRAGYAAAAFNYGDVQPDDPAKGSQGIMGALSGLHFWQNVPWGALCAWATAAMQARSVLAKMPSIDPRRIYVAGHSRGGKAALWAGAMDIRFAGVFASCSGCGGAALHRGKEGERIADITRLFPHWFTPAFREWAGREEALPFDQHQLLGLIAPRPLYITSATQDAWADPFSEFLSLRSAAPFWALYGKKGLRYTHFPRPGHPSSGCDCDYHIRRGVHDLTREDWLAALSFFTARAEANP